MATFITSFSRFINKMKVFGVVLCLATVSGLGIAQRVSYKDFKLYEITPENEAQSQAVYELYKTHPNFNFMKLARFPNETSHVVVSPKDQADFNSYVSSNTLKTKMIYNDISQDIKVKLRKFRQYVVPGQFDLNHYYSYNEIIIYLNALIRKYPQRIRFEKSNYNSYQGKDIPLVRIGDGNGMKSKVIFMDAGIHAREWITPMVALYTIYQLVENYDSNSDLLKDHDWLIMPIVNPDGYEYSRMYDPLWRKTRKPNLCGIGTDANRNFDSHWAEIGTSSSGCKETYHGDYAFSENESKAVAAVLDQFKSNIIFYLALHSYGNYMLYPWGFTSQLPNNWKNIHEVAKAGAVAIFSFNRNERYKVGSLTNTLYSATGGAMDYAMEKAGIPIAITMEIGQYTFGPHPLEISGLVKTSWVGVQAMARKATKNN